MGAASPCARRRLVLELRLEPLRLRAQPLAASPTAPVPVRDELDHALPRPEGRAHAAAVFSAARVVDAASAGRRRWLPEEAGAEGEGEGVKDEE